MTIAHNYVFLLNPLKKLKILIEIKSKRKKLIQVEILISCLFAAALYAKIKKQFKCLFIKQANVI